MGPTAGSVGGLDLMGEKEGSGWLDGGCMAKHLWAGSGWAPESVSVSERVRVCVLVAGVLRSVFGGGRVMGRVRNGERRLWLQLPPPFRGWVGVWVGGILYVAENSSIFNETSGRTE